MAAAPEVRAEGGSKQVAVYDVQIRDGDTGELVGKMVATPKTFQTGSTGYHAGDKLEIDGIRYQAQVQLVQIGSKPGWVPKKYKLVVDQS